MSYPGLTRDVDHRYHYKGRIIPGVTRVIDGTLRDLSKISREVLANAAEIGELVHEATAMDAEDALEESSIDPSITGYITAWRRFRSEVKPIIISSEEMVYHPAYDYAGQLDHRMIINNENGIVDKKTGVEDRADPVQLSAYRQARYHNEPDLARSTKMWILSLRKDGTYRLRNYADQFHIFLAALTCFRYKTGG